MSLFAGSHREDMLEAWQRDDQLAGNLCRCTGYAPIRRAAEEVATLSGRLTLRCPKTAALDSVMVKGEPTTPKPPRDSLN